MKIKKRKYFIIKGGKMKKVLLFLTLGLFVFSNLSAQSLEETIEDLSGKAAEGYVGPIVSAFGTNLNGGWFHKAPKSKFLNVDIELGIVFMGTTFPDEAKTFDITGNFRFTQEQATTMTQDFYDPNFPELQNALIEAIMNQDFEVGINGPTIVGPNFDELTGDNQIEVTFPGEDITVEYIDPNSGITITETVTVQSTSIPLGIGGLLEDMPMLPLMTPQLSVGTVYGTKLIVRYLPPMDLGEELGEFNYSGFGIQHNPKAWVFLPIPVDICASFFTQKMVLGNYIKASATAFGINVSKQFGFRMLNITPYAGLLMENSKMEFSYEYVIGENPVTGQPMDPQEIKFEIEGENSGRLTLGTSFRLGVFNINADYNIGAYNSITAGFGLGF